VKPPPASAPAVCFDDRRRLRRPRPAALIALAGLFAAAAVPTGLLATASTSHADRPPAKSVSRSVAAVAGASASITAAGTVVRLARNADGSNLARRLANDPALRRTLQALQSVKHAAGTPAASIVIGGSVADIPAVALAAYQRAAFYASISNPGCDIPWTLVAAIGRVESDHGQFGGSKPGTDGEVRPAILGPRLDGSGGNAAVPDSDGGRYDGDARWDRAVGPMQFIPQTWAIDGRDGNGDEIRDPENMFDAALATANYLCASGGDLSTPAAAERAALSYNHSLEYALVVLGYSSAYGGQDVSSVTAEIAKYLAAVSKAAKAAKAKLKKPARKAAKKTHRPVTPRKPPAPHPTVKPTAKPTPSPSPKPTSKPTPTPSATPSPTPTPTPTESPSPSASPSETSIPVEAVVTP
jgi:membrane-bound lytic murein transglycosylase B